MDPREPQEVWKALLQRVSGKPAFSWLRFVELASLEDDRAVLRVLPGHREVHRFASETRLSQIGEHLQPIVGRRVRVSIQAEESSSQEQASATSAHAATNERRDALNLPLVKQALQAFPDASVVEVRAEAVNDRDAASADSDAESTQPHAEGDD